MRAAVEIGALAPERVPDVCARTGCPPAPPRPFAVWRSAIWRGLLHAGVLGRVVAWRFGAPTRIVVPLSDAAIRQAALARLARWVAVALAALSFAAAFATNSLVPFAGTIGCLIVAVEIDRHARVRARLENAHVVVLDGVSQEFVAALEGAARRLDTSPSHRRREIIAAALAAGAVASAMVIASEPTIPHTFPMAPAPDVEVAPGA